MFQNDAEQEQRRQAKLADEKAAWEVHKARQAREDAVNQLKLTDPKKARKLFAELRAEDAEAEATEEKERVRRQMETQWVAAGGTAAGFTDAVFETLYLEMVKQRTLDAMMGKTHRVVRSPVRF